MRINFLVAKDRPGGVELGIHAHNYDASVRAYYYANHNGRFYNRPLLSEHDEVTDPVALKELKDWMTRRN